MVSIFDRSRPSEAGKLIQNFLSSVATCSSQHLICMLPLIQTFIVLLCKYFTVYIWLDNGVTLSYLLNSIMVNNAAFFNT